MHVRGMSFFFLKNLSLADVYLDWQAEEQISSSLIRSKLLIKSVLRRLLEKRKIRKREGPNRLLANYISKKELARQIVQFRLFFRKKNILISQFLHQSKCIITI